MNWLYLLTIAQAFAAGGEHGAHGDAHAIPWNSIFVQGFNLGLLLLFLTYILRKTVKAHFETRAREYKQMVEKAETARTEAERGRREIKDRLAKLEAEAAQTTSQARAEANELRSRMMQEAKALTERLQQEAARTAAVELEKAKAELRREILNQALDKSRENLKKDINPSVQLKLQKEFADKIQVVSG